MKEGNSPNDKEKIIEENVKKLLGCDRESLLKEMDEAEREWEEMQANDPEAAAKIIQEMNQGYDQLLARLKDQELTSMSLEEIQKEEETRKQLMNADLSGIEMEDEEEDSVEEMANVICSADVENVDKTDDAGGLKAGIDVPVPTRKRWFKRKGLLLVAAVCVLGLAMTMVTVANREFQYRTHVRDEEKYSFVQRNYQQDEHTGKMEDAYARISSDLGIKPLGFFASAEDMEYVSISIVDRIAILKIRYKNKFIHLHEAALQDSGGTVELRRSDCQVIDVVHNPWIDENMEICENILSNGDREYASYISTDTAIYSVSGIFEKKEEFITIVRELQYFE